jgi:uncharacterized protein
VRAGERLRVIDVEGQQVGDLFAFCTNDVSEYASAEHTRVQVGRLFPRVGEHFVTNRRRPILFFEEDGSPGVHDMLCAACDSSRYASLGADAAHASCQENLRTAIAAIGHDQLEVPQPINLFMNAPVRDDGTIALEPALTRAGDFVRLRAELDCIVVLSACPQDLAPINGAGPTGLAIEFLD